MPAVSSNSFSFCLCACERHVYVSNRLSIYPSIIYYIFISSIVCVCVCVCVCLCVLASSCSMEIQQLVGHSGPVYSTSFNPDNTFLVSGSEDGTGVITMHSRGQREGRGGDVMYLCACWKNGLLTSQSICYCHC